MKLYTEDQKRRGAAVVEFAVVAPVFILLVFGMIEFGRPVMVQQVVFNASREEARQAVLDGASLVEIEGRVDNYLSASNIDNEQLIYTGNGTEVPDPTTVAGFGDSVGVEIRVNFEDVSCMPVPHTLVARSYEHPPSCDEKLHSSSHFITNT